jgi:lysophospholipase L1-like esterase
MSISAVAEGAIQRRKRTTAIMRDRSIAQVACLSAGVTLLALLVTRLDVASKAHGVGAASPNPQIAVIGDSIAYGAYDTLRGGWVTRLERTLQRDYPGARLRILNAARNGGNSGHLVEDLRRLQRQVDPALIIIAYGLNDFDERVAPHVLAAHLRDGLRLLRTWPHPPAVVLLGLPPITALSPARLRVERAYTDVIRRVALAARAGYLDQFDLWLALGPRYLHTLRHDTEHPNHFGYAFTAEAVAAFLEGAYLDGHGHIRPPPDPPTCSVVLCAS